MITIWHRQKFKAHSQSLLPDTNILQLQIPFGVPKWTKNFLRLLMAICMKINLMEKKPGCVVTPGPTSVHHYIRGMLAKSILF